MRSGKVRRHRTSYLITKSLFFKVRIYDIPHYTSPKGKIYIHKLNPFRASERLITKGVAILTVTTDDDLSKNLQVSSGDPSDPTRERSQGRVVGEEGSACCNVNREQTHTVKCSSTIETLPTLLQNERKDTSRHL